MKHDRKSRRPPIWKIGLYMLLMGILGTWILALAYPLAIEAGIPTAVAFKLPYAGFFAGLALGLGIGLSTSIKQIFAALGGIILLGSVFWFFGVVLEGLLIGFGVSPDLAEWLSPVAFCLGVVLGLIPIFAISGDAFDTLRGR